MFGFMKKSEPIIYAPIKGKCIPLENVQDKVFASKMMGEGLAFVPQDNKIYSPLNAKVSMIAATKHAIGLVGDDGIEVLIHIGIDTVNYAGNGFKVYVDQDKKVKRGELLISFDKDMFEKDGVDLTTPMIITNSSSYNLELYKIDNEVDTDDQVIRYQKKVV